MNMLRQALALWKTERQKKETTLHRRLVMFFISVTVVLVLAFTLLLTLFGITGREETALQNYFSTELSDIVSTATDDFGRLSVDGINLAEGVSARCDDFFRRQGISAAELQDHPELLEDLLAEQAAALINLVEYRSCGGAFVMLDATVNPAAETATTNRAGIFIKKTQPTSTQAVGVKLHWLRGPATIARENGIELLGQWKMEYDTKGQEFFAKVMQTAREHPDFSLSRLYYWSGRVTLKGNSETGFLLCVPLRAADGTVFGLCGIEVSDRMIKSMYSPAVGTYADAFAVISPADNDSLNTSRGIIAGNYYLTGTRMQEDLLAADSDEFEMFKAGSKVYGGKSARLRLYPSASPYEQQAWGVAVLMEEKILNEAASGNSSYFILIVAVLLVLSIGVSLLISRRYLRPVTAAFEAVRNNDYEENDGQRYLEINDFLAFLAQKDKEKEEELRRLEQQHQSAQADAERAQTELYRFVDKKRREVDPEDYAVFLGNLQTLTKKEREVFELYLEGKKAKEIVELMGFSDNALKYHNKNLYSKLGVNSRKELLLYAEMLKQEQKAQKEAGE